MIYTASNDKRSRTGKRQDLSLSAFAHQNITMLFTNRYCMLLNYGVLSASPPDWLRGGHALGDLTWIFVCAAA